MFLKRQVCLVCFCNEGTFYSGTKFSFEKFDFSITMCSVYERKSSGTTLWYYVNNTFIIHVIVVKGFSKQMVSILQDANIHFSSFDVLQDIEVQLSLQ